MIFCSRSRVGARGRRWGWRRGGERGVEVEREREGEWSDQKSMTVFGVSKSLLEENGKPKVQDGWTPTRCHGQSVGQRPQPDGQTASQPAASGQPQSRSLVARAAQSCPVSSSRPACSCTAQGRQTQRAEGSRRKAGEPGSPGKPNGPAWRLAWLGKLQTARVVVAAAGRTTPGSLTGRPTCVPASRAEG